MTSNLNRRDFMKRSALLAAPLLSSRALSRGTQSKEVRKPNIIFVFADQLRSHVLSCYGNQQVKTPHLDRLAREGIRFDNAISTWPVCSPYRAMLLTGLCASARFRYPVIP